MTNFERQARFYLAWTLLITLSSAVIVLGQANNYARESDEKINWRERGVSIARDWNEALLYCVRRDLARPCVHARNIFHWSVAVYAAWAAYAPEYNKPYLFNERVNLAGLTSDQVEAMRNETISFAAYHLIARRFDLSPGRQKCMAELERKLSYLGFDVNATESSWSAARLLGKRIAQNVLDYYINDGANEIGNYNYTNLYSPVNQPLAVAFPGNQYVVNINKWQSIAVGTFVDQSGVLLSEYPAFIGPHWGRVRPFSLKSSDLSPTKSFVYMDPGPPPLFPLDDRYPVGEQGNYWRMNHTWVAEVSGWLSPTEGPGTTLIDISPAALGNNPLGANTGSGRSLNPKTGQPYVPQRVPLGDYTRVLAEFWADGPHSETPPGHWNVILNYVSYHPEHKRRFKNLDADWAQFDPLEWDVKAYFTLNGAMHDVAVSAWGIKGFYDSSRPVAALRYMAMRGQSSNSSAPSFSHHGLPLIPGTIELITSESSQPGERHAHLASSVGKVAVLAWRGHDAIQTSGLGYAGVGWILAEKWLPYQQATFVTPPFAGYISGHSTYSRAAAEVLTLFTGSEFFPGGMHRFLVPNTTFLVFEKGPSVDMELQWATYQDASDQCSLSRIYGGIHPSMDDLPGRRVGFKIGHQAFEQASAFYVPPPPPTDSPLVGAAQSTRSNRENVTFAILLVLFCNFFRCILCKLDNFE